jgi:hypothetical protein
MRLARTGRAKARRLSTSLCKGSRIFNGTVTSLNPSGVPYAVSDRANAGGLGSIFNTPADTSNHTYYWTDNTHLTNLGYGIVGTADKAAILSQ